MANQITTVKGKSDDLTLMMIMQRFSTDESAREYIENLRWPHGPICPHCGNADRERHYKVAANVDKRILAGLYKCAECSYQFTVTVGTVMEDSHIPLDKWLVAFFIMCASKTQTSALQLQRQLELGSYRSAWFLCRRIRFALMDVVREGKLTCAVVAGETYIGGRTEGRGRGFVGNKIAVVSLAGRHEQVRSQVVGDVTGREIAEPLKLHVAEEVHLNTNESRLRKKAGRDFALDDVVIYWPEEYNRFDAETGCIATTNTTKGFFGNRKQSIGGTHHISKQHIGLYFAEPGYKYNSRKNTDGARAVGGSHSLGGKRLTLRRQKAKVD